MYKLSDNAIDVISSIIKDSNKTNYKISTKDEMEEFCFSIALLMGFNKDKDPEQKSRMERIKLVLEEIHNNLDDIDYEDMNNRISL